jgi:protein O-GlcNAc transferase
MSDFELAKKFFLEGLSALQDRRYEEAESKLRRSLELLPDRVSTLTNLSAALIRLQKFPEAEQYLLRIIALEPGAGEAWLNLGLIEVHTKNNSQRALEFFDRALAANADYAEAWVNRGSALRRLYLFEEAFESFDRAIAIAPDLADAYACRGGLNFLAGSKERALDDFKTAYASNPEMDYLLGDLLLAKASLCDWEDWGALTERLANDIEAGARCSPPFSILSLVDAPLLQKRAAEIFDADGAQGARF